MTTHWQGRERDVDAELPVDMTRPYGVSREPANQSGGAAKSLAAGGDGFANEADEPAAVPDDAAAGSEVEPLVRGRRSAELLPADTSAALVPAETGWRSFIRAATFGLIRPKVGREELERREDIAAAQRTYSRPQTVVMATPKGGMGKTLSTVGLGSTFGINNGTPTLCWDANETMGTLALRTMSNASTKTVWDLMGELDRFEHINARRGDLSGFIRRQGDNRFDVLASDEDPDRMRDIGRDEFDRIHHLVSRFYDLMFVDTGNNTRAENWLAAVEHADQLVIPTPLKTDGVVSAMRMIEQLENTGHSGLVRNAVVLLTQGGGKRDSPQKQQQLREALSDCVRVVIDVPYDVHLDDGAIIDWRLVAEPTRRAFERASAAVAEGLTSNDQKEQSHA